jgi:phosphoesterase RecJ-like protein
MIDNFIHVLKGQLSTPKKVVIIPHKNPDGDALGSCLGWKHFLDQMGHFCGLASRSRRYNKI